MKPRTILLAAAFLRPAGMTLAQGAMPDVKTVLASADIDGLIANAKAQPAKPLIIQKIVGTGAYSANLEYRAGAAAPASIHDNENELMVFKQGTGTIVIGGALVDGTRSNPANQAGSSISGGKSQHVASGDVLIVPAGVAHQIVPDAGSAVVVITFHVPQPWPGK